MVKALINIGSDGGLTIAVDAPRAAGTKKGRGRRSALLASRRGVWRYAISIDTDLGNLLSGYFPAAASADLRAASNSSPGFQVGSGTVFAICRPASKASWASSTMPSKFQSGISSSLAWW